MEIYKDTYPGIESKSDVESEIQKAEAELIRSNEGKTFPFKSQSWALEIVRLGTKWEFIDKTGEEAQQDEADESKLDTEIKEENDRAALFAQAKSDPEFRDRFILSEMGKAGFTMERLVFALVFKEVDENGKSEFWESVSKAKQSIVDEIESTG